MPINTADRDHLHKKILKQLGTVYCAVLPQAKHIQQKVSKKRVWLR